jgi:hypothetical protein
VPSQSFAFWIQKGFRFCVAFKFYRSSGDKRSQPKKLDSDLAVKGMVSVIDRDNEMLTRSRTDLQA